MNVAQLIRCYSVPTASLPIVLNSISVADKPDRIAVTSTSSRAKSSPRKITLNLQLTGPRCRVFRSCNREHQLSFPTTGQRNRQSEDESLGDSMKHLYGRLHVGLHTDEKSTHTNTWTHER